ncbi:hypothetical protein BGW38_009853 [Lunasporangiospora selenospora]|uniref:Guanine nucleotide-binding protein subunit gamma n=1 Tax=Lunasporangiospora selenospora TaxID=979761 RepID=A0A9P6FWR1_9FUNG|nr:hypothetical protein BGW38_009853 [Lunasporangiospora selenospora]
MVSEPLSPSKPLALGLGASDTTVSRTIVHRDGNEPLTNSPSVSNVFLSATSKDSGNDGGHNKLKNKKSSLSQTGDSQTGRFIQKSDSLVSLLESPILRVSTATTTIASATKASTGQQTGSTPASPLLPTPTSDLDSEESAHTDLRGPLSSLSLPELSFGSTSVSPKSVSPKSAPPSKVDVPSAFKVAEPIPRLSVSETPTQVLSSLSNSTDEKNFSGISLSGSNSSPGHLSDTLANHPISSTLVNMSSPAMISPLSTPAMAQAAALFGPNSTGANSNTGLLRTPSSGSGGNSGAHGVSAGSTAASSTTASSTSVTTTTMTTNHNLSSSTLLGGGGLSTGVNNMSTGGLGKSLLSTSTGATMTSGMTTTGTTVSDIKLKRFLEHNQRLKEQLDLNRISVSEASESLIKYVTLTKDSLLPTLWGTPQPDPFSKQSTGCCKIS